MHIKNTYNKKINNTYQINVENLKIKYKIISKNHRIQQGYKKQVKKLKT